MGFFDGNDDEKKENEYNSGLDTKKDSDAGKYLVFVLFMPAYFLGNALTGLFVLKKMNPKKIYKIAALIAGVGIIGLFIYFAVFNGVGRILESLKNYTDVLGIIISIGIPMLLLCLPIGAAIGGMKVFKKMRFIKLNPHLTKVPGTWMYGLDFEDHKANERERQKIAKLMRNGSYIDSERAPLGIHEERNLPAFRYDSEANKHTLIVGASGSGKSITMLNLVYRDIVEKRPVIFIDMKADPELASKLSVWSNENDCNFYHFYNSTPERYDIKDSRGLSYYDPMKNGTATSRSDMLLNMREYDAASEHYKTNMMQLLQIFVPLMAHVMRDRKKMASVAGVNWGAGWMQAISDAAKPEIITKLVELSQDSPKADNFNYLARALTDKKDNPLKHALNELAGQLRIITGSEYGDWLRVVNDPNANNDNKLDRNIDLLKMSKTEGNVVLFSINSDSEPDFAKFITSMIMTDLTVVSAVRREKQIDNPVGIYIDEFQTINPMSVKGLLEKARSSGFAMTLAQQSFEQIAALGASGPALLNSMIDTCSNFIVHAGMARDSAERLSKIAGKHEETVYRTVGKSRESKWFDDDRIEDLNIQTDTKEVYRILPETFMNLSAPDKNNNYKASAVVLNKTCSDPEYYNPDGGATGRVVTMIPHDKIIQKGYYRSSRIDIEEDQAYLDVEYVEPDFVSEFSFIPDNSRELDNKAQSFLAILNANPKTTGLPTSKKHALVKQRMVKEGLITVEEINAAEAKTMAKKEEEKNSGYSTPNKKNGARGERHFQNFRSLDEDVETNMIDDMDDYDDAGLYGSINDEADDGGFDIEEIEDDDSKDNLSAFLSSTLSSDTADKTLGNDSTIDDEDLEAALDTIDDLADAPKPAVVEQKPEKKNSNIFEKKKSNNLHERLNKSGNTRQNSVPKRNMRGFDSGSSRFSKNSNSVENNEVKKPRSFPDPVDTVDDLDSLPDLDF